MSRNFVLCVHVETVVRTADSSPAAVLDDVPHPASRHVIVAVDGLAGDRHEMDAGAAAAATHSIRLASPAEATRLVDMQLDPQSVSCQLRALYHTANTLTDDDDDDASSAASGGSSGAVFWTYPPSSLSTLSRIPVATHPDYLLDSVAQQERERIASLSFISQVCGNLDEEYSLDDVLFQIDRRYLQYLFRPSFPRGNGTVLPPSPKHIRRAMRLLMGPSYQAFGITHNSSNSSSSVELEVVRFVQELRQRELYRARSTKTPLCQKQQQQRTSGIATTPDNGATKGVLNYYTGGGGASLYDALENEEEPSDDDNVEMGEDIASAPDDENLRDKQREVKEHETRARLAPAPAFDLRAGERQAHAEVVIIIIVIIAPRSNILYKS